MKYAAIAIILFLATCVGAPARAQAPQGDIDPSGIQLTREQLKALLARYEQSSQSSAYSAELRGRAEQEAQLVRDRLEHGDFKIGDQISLVVEREEALTDTFVVQAGPAIVLPTVGSIPLDGILRSELEPHLTQQLQRFIRDPVVHARSLFRVVITGAVGHPGFFVIPAEALLTDALMTAGGPAANAKLEKIRIERSGRPIWEGAALQQAITEGRTVDQLSLTAGDHIVVPQASGQKFGWETILGAASSLALLVTVFTRF
jgi:protein involved in polysaccharide export with SLBB domain